MGRADANNADNTDNEDSVKVVCGSAEADAAAIVAQSKATAEGIRLLAESINALGGKDAVGLKIAEQYVEAFKQIAKESSTILLPANASDASSMVTQALSIFRQISSSQSSGK